MSVTWSIVELVETPSLRALVLYGDGSTAMRHLGRRSTSFSVTGSPHGDGYRLESDGTLVNFDSEGDIARGLPTNGHGCLEGG